MCKKLVLLLTYVCVLMLAGTASAAPVLFYHATLDDEASITSTGGYIVDGPASFVSGALGNAFAGNNLVYAQWDDDEVGAIFDEWDDDAGITVDLYFQGNHWSTHSGDSGLWSISRRASDRYIILSVQNSKIRIPFRDADGEYKYHITGVTLENNIAYRLTVRQANGAFDVYLNGGAYNNDAPVFSANDLPADYTWNFPNAGGSPSRRMNIGNRAIFGGLLKNGEWVDDVRVYNGFYSPAELDVPYVSNPRPGIDEKNVAPDVVLEWDAPDPNFLNELPALYNVYFSTEPNELSPNFTLVSEKQLETFYDPLGAGLLDVITDYYWRIDVVDPNHGEAIEYTGTGDRWHFTTIPPKATEPFPDDNATNVAQNVVLSWTSGFGAISHNVFISTIQSEVENGTILPVNIAVAEYDPPNLDWETEYFWRVDEVFAGNGDPAAGDIWSFTTGSPECEYDLGGDADNNCIVDLRDFAIMASNWLECNLANGDCP